MWLARLRDTRRLVPGGFRFSTDRLIVSAPPLAHPFKYEYLNFYLTLILYGIRMNANHR